MAKKLTSTVVFELEIEDGKITSFDTVVGVYDRTNHFMAYDKNDFISTKVVSAIVKEELDSLLEP